MHGKAGEAEGHDEEAGPQRGGEGVGVRARGRRKRSALDSWYDAYGSRYASFVASGIVAENGAARSAISANATTSSSIEVALTVTEPGR